MSVAAPLALVFPGQGSQWVGMGREFHDAYPEARAAFAEADEALGEAISEVCFAGPEALLGRTIYSQPAILTCSIAIWRALAARCDRRPIAAAGHSLGEYSALVAAGALTLAEGVRLVRERGHCMEQAAGGAGMLALLGISDEAAEALAREASAAGSPVAVANYNCPGQVVLGGADAGLDAAAELARAQGVRRAQRLAISVASHTPLMAPAADCLAEKAAAVPISDAAYPVVGNAGARALRRAADVRAALPVQLVQPLHWPACVARLVELGAAELWEVGPRSVLAGLCRRIDGAPPVRPITSVAEMTALLQIAEV